MKKMDTMVNWTKEMGVGEKSQSNIPFFSEKPKCDAVTEPVTEPGHRTNEGNEDNG